MDEGEQVRRRYTALRGRVDERALRLWAASEAQAHGRGGAVLVAAATGMSRQRTIDGLRELQEPVEAAVRDERVRIRRPGGGRKRLERTDATLLADLEALVDPATRGDPQSPLRWTCKSTAHLATALAQRGHRVDARTVARLLKQQRYSLQSNRKTREGADHPDRDAQFRYINAQTERFQRRGQPVISVDTKKKELIGDFKQGGREWEPVGRPVQVNVHDFPDPELGKGIPYGVFDVTANQGWVSVGTDHDTSAFAVQSIRSWWWRMGRSRYPEASNLLVIADGGGSNGSRARLWKHPEGTRLADRMGCLKAGIVANVVVPHPDYVRFATHYGFHPDFCEARDPESKGVVEALVGYAKTDLVVPAGSWPSVVEANAAATAWCAEVNSRLHSEIAAVPTARLATEGSVLRSLPTLRVSPPSGVLRKVDRLATVRFGSARYSVPVELVGQSVELVVQGGMVLVVRAGAEVARHLIVAPGEVALIDAHYGGPRSAPTRPIRPRAEQEVAFLALGPVAEQFLRTAAAAGTSRLQSELTAIVALEAAWGRAALLAALERSLQFHRFRADDVRSILMAGAGVATPVPAGDALPMALGLPAVPTRSLDAYALAEVVR